MIVNNPFQLIGNTPMIHLNKLSKKMNCNIYLKLEKYNLTGSSKDRAVYNMIQELIDSKKINSDTTIVEPTSGNTGISLACICSYLSIKCIIVMMENSNIERIKLIRSYGAKIIFTPSAEKMQGSIKMAQKMLKENKNYIMLSQFDNYDNVLAHYKTTGKEIYLDLPFVDCVCLTYGTGGTISGTCKYLKEKNKDIACVAIKPKDKNHHIIGIASNVKSKNYYKENVDYTISVDDVSSFKMMKYVALNEGIMIGISSACALSGAILAIKKHHYKNVVVICPDGYERYLSNEYLFYLENVDKSKITNDLAKMYNHLFTINKNDDIFLKYFISSEEIKRIYSLLLSDAKSIYQNDPAAQSLDEVINLYPGFYAIFVYRIAHVLWLHEEYYIARMMSEIAHEKTGIDIHPQAKIDKGLCIDHGTGIVIGQTCVIGKNVRIYQGVTLGAKSLNKPNEVKNIKRHPTIKDNVIIYSNASILGGDTTIGENCIIGANTFITSSILKDTMVYLNQKQYQIIKQKK